MQLDEHFSRPVKEFVSLCLKKVPAEVLASNPVIFAFFYLFPSSGNISRSLIQDLLFQRPSAKELIKHRFIKNAKKSPKLLERIRFVFFSLSSTALLACGSVLLLFFCDRMSKVMFRWFYPYVCFDLLYAKSKFRISAIVILSFFFLFEESDQSTK